MSQIFSIHIFVDQINRFFYEKQIKKSQTLLVIPPFHWATICSRSKPIWKSGRIGDKRELNGSDRKLIGNERQRSGMVGKVGGDL